MGDRLGIHGAVDILHLKTPGDNLFWAPDIGAEARLASPSPKSLSKKIFSLSFFLSLTEILPCFNVYGHIMLKTPVLVRSLKLSNIEPR